MALINCPECGHQVSNVAKNCPHCGYIINQEHNCFDVNRVFKTIIEKPSVFFICIVMLMCMMLTISWQEPNAYKNNRNNYNSSNYSETKVNSSTIFNNLHISNFSASLGKHAGTMSCEVRNNNGFTVHGYFYVNFYDKNGSLIYSQLMSLPHVASGEKVVCNTPIPKGDYPTGYSYVEYSQASLTKD